MVQIPSGLPVTNQNLAVAANSGPPKWAVGAVISAIVTGPTVDKLLPLRIGGLDATAQTGLTLQPGTRLQLRVIANNPILTLRVLAEPKTVQESPVSAAMRQALPRQTGLPPLLANLNWLASQNPQQLPTAMRELATSAQQLLTQLFRPSDLAKPSGLQKAVIDSGIFLESKLASLTQTPLSFKGDLKAGFLRLQQLTNNSQALQIQLSATTAVKNPVRSTQPPATTDLRNPAPQIQPSATTTFRSLEPQALLQATAGIKNLGLQELSNMRWLATRSQAQMPPQLQNLAQLSIQLLGQLSSTQLSSSSRNMVIESSLYLEGKLRGLNLKTLQTSSNLESILAKLRPISQLLSSPATNSPSTAQLPSSSSSLNTGSSATTATTGPGQESTLAATKPAITNSTAPVLPHRGAAVSAQPQTVADLPTIANLGSQIAHLHKQLEGALSRIQLHQLASLPVSAEAADRAWVFELPIRYNDTTQLMHISIDTDESGPHNDTMQQTWTANLAFDLPELGAVHARISLRGDQLSTIFWAPSEITTAHFQSALPELDQRLCAAGFKAPRVQALHGMPPEKDGPSPVPEQHLIDLST